jgi:uncharacterized protein YwgA
VVAPGFGCNKARVFLFFCPFWTVIMRRHSDKHVEALLCFFIKSLPYLGRTQLVKLLYLTDLESRKLRGRPVTDLRYIWRIYGPFEERIIDNLTALRNRRVIHEVGQRFPGGACGYTYRMEKQMPVSSYLPKHDLAIAEYVEAMFGKASLRSLLEDVVYQTKPMMDAKEREAFGQRLRMNLVDYDMPVDLDKVAGSVAQLKSGGGKPFRKIWAIAKELRPA